MSGVDWTKTVLAPTRDHHRFEGRRLYAHCFDAVEKFHAPGLAPVRRAGRAWHIDVYGEPGYSARFAQTFGYYDGLAAVDTGAGWTYVDIQGRPIADARYLWCGNFQNGRAPVRDQQCRYFHVDGAGQPVYVQRWRYAGDYRDGRAVVQRDDGLHTHIDLRGELVHDRWFLDLDVFHKGFARARDEDGWTHVDGQGRPLYAARFAAVEPFYNGQARVEGPGGELLVIEEGGQTVAELRPSRRSSFAGLSADLVGYWRTRTIATAVEIGVFEALPGPLAQIAERGCMTPSKARRLLRALGELGLIERIGKDDFGLTDRGALLVASHPWSLAEAAVEYASTLAEPWTQLRAALTDPSWRPPSVFEEVAKQPGRGEGHHRMLQSYARHDYVEVADAIVALDLRGDERIVDAGGGLGVLAGLLHARAPGLRLLILDRPEVVAMLADTSPAGRAADLFEPWPVAEVEIVILARVLHDWDDDRARRVLARAAAALAVNGRLLIVEQILDPKRYGGSLVDLHLLAVNGGRERDLDEWRELLGSVDLELTRVVSTSQVPSLLEARKR